MKKAEELIKEVQGMDLAEAVDVGEVIQSLIDTDHSDDNAGQGKIAQLIKGLAFSDDPKSDQFMKKLTDHISDANYGDLT